MNNTSTAKLLWVDLEMTGLDPAIDVITEVAAIATDWDFNEIATYESGVSHDEGVVSGLMAQSDFWQAAGSEAQQAMLAQSSSGKTDDQIQQALLKMISEHFGDEPVILAGNSIHQDRRFIRKHWPELDARLHYRMLDVSAWKVVMMGKYDVEFEKQSVHRAMDDIRESIAELTQYLTMIRP